MILFLLTYIIYIVYRSMEAMHMLQQNLYNENNRYLKWTIRNISKIFCIFDFIPLLFFAFVYVSKDYTLLDLFYVSSMFVYIYCIYHEYSKNKDNQNKLPLKVTARIKRLFITFIIVVGFILILTIKESNMDIKLIYFMILCFIEIIIYYLIFICSIIDTPLNGLEYLYYYNKAKRKLKERKDLTVIGITGSYGKTSSKNILNDILSSKYITRATPKNYNTPYGLMITINNYLDKFDNVLIAEMGAYKMGRIKNLCDFVHPKYGILTVIGEAHLETFGSRENICKTKFELIESLPSDGVAILNKDDPYQVNYKLKNNVPVIWIGVLNHDADIYATNINYGSYGMSFTCNYNGEKINVKTRLLGKHNIYNILAGIALGLHLKVDINDIKSSILTLKPTEHRLELKKLNDIYMLDDAYNSNPIGAKSALETLSMMHGTKVVVTPGMVELGKVEKEKNYEFGKEISNVADYCILIGEKKTKAIYDGLIENNFDKDNIFILNNVKDSYGVVEALKEEGKDIFALYENDLPDIYEEVRK